MTVWQRMDWPGAMASRWRRRRVCELLSGGQAHKVALRDISGREAQVETPQPPALGCSVELRHPVAGTIGGRVSGICEGGVRISFDRQEAAIAFALGAIAADMTRD